MFLQEPKANAFLAEVGCQACWSPLIEYLNPFLYFLYNDDFGLFKKSGEIVRPLVLTSSIHLDLSLISIENKQTARCQGSESKKKD